METNEQMEQNVETTEQEETKAEPKQPEKKYTDAEVDKIVQDRLAREQKKREKEVAEAEKLAKMNEKERYDYEVSELKKELDALKAEKVHAELAKTAKDLIQNELNVRPQDGLADALVRDTAEATNEAVKGFIAFFNEYFKLKVSGSEPKKGGTSALSREEIFNIKDPNKRLKAIEENMELFNQKG